MKNTFYISAPVDTYSGYGARSRDIIKSLIELDKYNIKILSQRWGDTRRGFLNDFPEWEFMEKYIVPQILSKPDIWCQISVPNEFQSIGAYNIGITAGIETTACAPQWIEGCNRMDLILTSSEHSKRVFELTNYEVQNKQNGGKVNLSVTTPIKVLFEGANLDVYKPLKEPMTNDELYKSIDSIPEKFKNKSNAPALILKCSLGKGSHMDRREIMKRISSIRKSLPITKLPNIYLIHGDLSDAEMNELYNHPKIKSMVSATKGEGFGRPLLEFALTGKPIIATGWSGHVDFLNPKLTALMGGELSDLHPSSIQKDILIEGSQWFDVNHGHLGHYLTDVKKNYKEWLPKSKTLSRNLRKNFSYSAMKNLLGSILNENVKIPTKMELKLPKLKKLTPINK